MHSQRPVGNTRPPWGPLPVAWSWVVAQHARGLRELAPFVLVQSGGDVAHLVPLGAQSQSRPSSATATTGPPLTMHIAGPA